MRFYITLTFLFTAPFLASASVIINEIAWMGTLPKEGESVQAAANNEWIELYNDGASAVSLEGWSVVSEDAKPNILLTGSIAAGGYFLLERANDDVVPSIMADIVYSYKDNALANSGELLFLRDAGGAVIDEINAVGGWPAGDNDTKDTMQRTGGGWISAAPTPRAANATTPPVSNDPPTEEDTVESNINPSSFPSTSPPPSPTPIPKVLAISAHAGEDRMVVVGSFVEFAGSAMGLDAKLLESARFWWNFGDGASKEGRVVNHLYQIPGTYTVGLHVSSGEYAASDLVMIEVVANQISVEDVVLGEVGFVRLTNDARASFDIGGWSITDTSGAVFTIPPRTMIGVQAEVAFINTITGLLLSATSTHLVVRYPNGILASSYTPSTMADEIIDVTVEDQPILVQAITPPTLKVIDSIPASKTLLDTKLENEFEQEDYNVVATQATTAIENLAYAGASQPDRVNLFFPVAAGISFVAAAGYVILRRKYL